MVTERFPVDPQVDMTNMEGSEGSFPCPLESNPTTPEYHNSQNLCADQFEKFWQDACFIISFGQ